MDQVYHRCFCTHLALKVGYFLYLMHSYSVFFWLVIMLAGLKGLAGLIGQPGLAVLFNVGPSKVCVKKKNYDTVTVLT